MDYGSYLVSTDPQYVPDQTAIDKAMASLGGFYERYEAFESIASDPTLQVTLPCCGKRWYLPDLRALEKLLGCRLQPIWYSV